VTPPDVDLAPERAVCLFHGARDTHVPTLRDMAGNEVPNAHPWAGQPYGSISGAQIFALMKNPGAHPKDKASMPPKRNRVALSGHAMTSITATTI
jgi:hypothetical protein